jgi:hypothetical protein
MVDGGVIASRFEEEAVSRRRIWDSSVDESRGRVATLCVDILRIYLGAPEKNDRVGCAQRGLCTYIDVVLRLLFRAKKLWWGGVPGRQFPPQHPANLITTSLFLFHGVP